MEAQTSCLVHPITQYLQQRISTGQHPASQKVGVRAGGMQSVLEIATGYGKGGGRGVGVSGVTTHAPLASSENARF